MLLGKILIVFGGAIGMSTAYKLMAGVQFYNSYWWGHPELSVIVTPEENKCTEVPIHYAGSMKMLGSMECAIFADDYCQVSSWWPKSKWRRGPDDNTPKPLYDWIDLSGLNAGDRSNIGNFPQASFICRSFFNNLNDVNSSSKNVHVPFDKWHDAGEQHGGLDLVPVDPGLPH